MRWMLLETPPPFSKFPKDYICVEPAVRIVTTSRIIPMAGMIYRRC